MTMIGSDVIPRLPLWSQLVGGGLTRSRLQNGWNIDPVLFVLILLLSLVEGWRIVMFQLCGFCCMPRGR